ncbi:MAG: hypothetical protein KatS3mg110_3092 [Pirellulaceae bacterium]|nr:MAG: hypothetical protein KatS3mg082_3431 [Nitrospiraceae bacterium]GIW57033.1 MAG: hypothetical protein KatS3mg082_3437 [Nitrospiraceae bacterium]GIW95051.1 MAG: hypothetical protein KatS3mg110_3092 [Pirellulaceae bacterium]
MTLQPYFDHRPADATSEPLASGMITIWALAQLAARALAGLVPPPEELSCEAKAILFAARQRGMLEIKGSNAAFERSERLLAVHVEQDEELAICFRSRRNPRFTIRCLEGFRQLCAAGLVMHHFSSEFSLTEAGFREAARVGQEEVQAILDEASVDGTTLVP